jgi:predicted transcriptional regulator
MSKANAQPKRGRGRPRTKIDPVAVIRCAKIGCTVGEIAAVLGCNRATLQRNFAAVIKRAKRHGKSSLRKLQWRSARKGNVTMQIWLGKQMLGQSDKATETHEHKYSGGVKHTIDYEAVEAELRTIARNNGAALAKGTAAHN